MTTQSKIDPEFVQQIPSGDDRVRQVCSHCGFVDYENPKIVVGSVAVLDNRILLCKRAIEPRRGYWTLPAGYLEQNETAEAGALREAWEEARAKLTIDRLLAVYSVPRISQIQLIYRATLNSDDVAPGPESEQIMLAEWNDIPWADIAFPTVGWALRHYKESANAESFKPYSNPIDGL